MLAGAEREKRRDATDAPSHLGLDKEMDECTLLLRLLLLLPMHLQS